MKLGTTRRALLGALATAPITITLTTPAIAARPDTSEWDSRLSAYFDAREAYDDDLKAGDLRRAYDEHEADQRALCRKYGVSRTEEITNEAGRARVVASTERMFAAESAHERRFCGWREQTLMALMLTPAPTYAALRQKVNIAQSELLEDAGGKPMLVIIAADLAGIGGKEA